MIKMLDKFYNLLASATTLFISFYYVLTTDNPTSHWAVPGVVLVDILLLWLYSKDRKQSSSTNRNYRPSVSSGIFLVLIVPVTHLGELISLDMHSGHASMETQMWLSLGSTSAVMVRLLWDTTGSSRAGLGLLLLSAGMVFLKLRSPASLCLLGLDFFFVWTGLNYIPARLPKSFTFGELAVVLQLSVRFVNGFIFGYLEKSWPLAESYPLVLCTLTVLTVAASATVVVYLTSGHSSLLRFVLTYAAFAVVGLVFLHLTLPETPALWLINFVTEDCSRVFLLVTWLLLLAITLTWTANESLALNLVRHGKNCNRSPHETNSSIPGEDVKRETVMFAARKMFHVFIVLVYVPGLMVDVQFLFLASVAVFGVFIVVEAARAFKVPFVGDYINDVQKMFVDERDQGRVFLTHIYLLLGMSLPLWMSPRLFSAFRASPEMYAGVLALGVGDTVACVAGRALGRTHWPGSKKTVEGTVFSILAQMLMVAAGSMSGVVLVTSMTSVFAGVTFAALAEAFTDQIDNLVLPLILYPFLCFS